MTEMFRIGQSETLGRALRGSQRQLMDTATTSHPYYWAGFAIIGDAARPLLSSGTSGTQARTSGEGAAAE